MKTIGDSLLCATNALSASDSPRLDAEILLAHTLCKSRSHLFAWPEKTITDAQQQQFNELIDERNEGRPIAYLTGIREFWSLPLQVSENTLIPRPETELLVEFAINHIRKNAVNRLLDLGTGSGAIALAIASECPDIRICACDVSAPSLTIAQSNADKLKLKNIDFVQSNWFADLPDEKFELIVSNPPYIAEGDPHLTSGDVAFEPRSALVSGVDGLDAIRIIADETRSHLKSNGMLIVEHGFNQAESVRDIFQNCGFTAVESHQDLQGLDRISFGTSPDSVD